MKKVFAIFFLLVMIIPQMSLARIVPECITDNKSGPCGLCDFFLLINNGFKFIAFTLAPPVAVFLFIVAGFLFLTSAGVEDRVKKAKKIFVNVLIGLAIIYASWLVVGTLINVIGTNSSIEGWNKETWNQFRCQP